MKKLGVVLILIIGLFTLVGCKSPESKISFEDKLFEDRTDYIGEASNTAKLAANIFEFGGNKSGIKLQTDEEPYGITLYSDIVEYDEAELFNRASLLIGLVKNLGYVEVYEGEDLVFKTTLEEVNESLDFDIKEIGEKKEKLKEYLEEIKIVN